MKRPALTVGLMIQPAVLDAIGRNQQFRGRGLLGRFLYAEPTSKVGHRKAEAEPVPADVAAAYAKALRSLVVDLAGWVGDPVRIPITPEAHKDVVSILDATERELADGGVLCTLRDWGQKYVGAVMRIAGLLHLARYGASGVRRPIAQAEIIAAVRIGTYFKGHALRAFTTMQTDEATDNMIYVLDRIIRTGEKVLSERDIHREARSRFNTIAALRPVIANLIDRGFLAALPEPEPKGPGRKPSPRFAVHPNAAEYGTDWTQYTESSSGHTGQSVRTDGDAA